MTVDQRLLSVLKSPDPPQSMTELCSRASVPTQTAYPAISRLINNGHITNRDIPWRAARGTRLGRKPALVARPPIQSAPPSPSLLATNPLADLEAELKAVYASNGPDRVSALRALIDIRTMGVGNSSVPVPNDTPSMLAALVRILKSAGRELVDQAIPLAFPPETGAILDETTENSPSEAAPPEISPGDAPSPREVD